MKKALMFALCFAAVLNTFALNLPVKGDDDIENLKNSTLCVVLLEENQKYTEKLTKMHRPQLVKVYQEYIKTINDNLQAMVPQYIKMAKGIEYHTMSEIIAMPAATRGNYSFLVYDRAMQFTQAGPSSFQFDFYADNQEELKGMLDDYLDYIQFDCANPRYHGEDDYRRAIIIAKGRKKVSDQLFIQSYDMIIPTKGSMAMCFMNLQNQFLAAVNGDDKKQTKEEAKRQALEQVAKARTRPLLICKDNLDRNVTEVKIGAVFKYKFKIVTREEFDDAILKQDTSANLLVVYPADKSMGGYKPTVNYQHLIIDPGTQEVLLTVVPEATGAGMPPSYQKLNPNSFKDIVKAEDEITH